MVGKLFMQQKYVSSSLGLSTDLRVLAGSKILGRLGGVFEVTLGVWEAPGDLLGTSGAVLAAFWRRSWRPGGVRSTKLRKKHLNINDKRQGDENAETIKDLFGKASVA